MASIDWPTTLPVPRQEGYSESPPNNTIRSRIDSGAAKVRRRFTAGVRQLTVAYALTQTEVGYLDTFYVTTSKSGSLAFNYTHPRTGATVEARFLEPPVYSDFNWLALATVKLEVLP